MSAPPGNKFAAKQNRVITDTLRRVIAQNPDKVRQACEKALDKAAEGDLQAFREITDRLDGRASQTMEVTNHDAKSPSRDLDDTQLADIISPNGSSGTTGKKNRSDKLGGLH